MDREDLATPEGAERLRLSMAMLTPGQQVVLSREEAMLLFERLVELQRWALGRSCCHEPDVDRRRPEGAN